MDVRNNSVQVYSKPMYLLMLDKPNDPSQVMTLQLWSIFLAMHPNWRNIFLRQTVDDMPCGSPLVTLKEHK